MRERTPNIKALARRGDVDGLIHATAYQDFASAPDGRVADVGTQVRAEALVALGKLAPERAHPTLRSALRDPADEVRCEAVRMLATLDAPDTLARALRWLSPDGPSYRLALDALVRLPSVPPAVLADALVHREDDEPLDDEANELILAPVASNGAAAIDELLGLLVAALGDEREIVVERAAALLVRLSPESVPALVSELSAGPKAAAAARVLGAIADPGTLNVLVEALQHEDATVRRESAGALAELQDPAAVEPLLGATRDPDRGVRGQAGAALDRLGSTAVIVGIAALMQPMVEEAVRAAIPASEAEAQGSPQLLMLPTGSHARPPRTSGRLPGLRPAVASDEHT